MARRTYNQHCALAHTLDLVGERWTLLLLRELLTGPKRFTDLQRNLPGMGTNLLAGRLRELGDADVIERTTLPPPAASAVYRLTEHGRDLEHAVVELADWGLRTLARPESSSHVRPAWSVLALQAAFTSAGDAEDDEYELRIGGEVYRAAVHEGALEVSQGPALDPGLVVTADRFALLAVTSGGLSFEQALDTGAVRLEGNPAAKQRFIELFGLGARTPV